MDVVSFLSRFEALAAHLRQSSPLPAKGMATGKSSDDNKRDPIKQDSEESPLGSSPDGELGEQGDESHANPTPENQAPKRKGGRKPVCHILLCYAACPLDLWASLSRLEYTNPAAVSTSCDRLVSFRDRELTAFRSMQPPRRGSKETARLKLLSESDVRSTSSSSSRPSVSRSRH